MPITRRILIPVPIPIPPRHKMFLRPPKPAPLPPPITILNPTPSSLIRNLVLAPPEIVFHRGIPPRPRERRVIRVLFAIPPRPVCFRGRLPRFPLRSRFGTLLVDHADVYIRSLIREHVEETPAFWPAGRVAGTGIFGPDPAQGCGLSHLGIWGMSPFAGLEVCWVMVSRGSIGDRAGYIASKQAVNETNVLVYIYA